MAGAERLVQMSNHRFVVGKQNERTCIVEEMMAVTVEDADVSLPDVVVDERAPGFGGEAGGCCADDDGPA